MRVVRKADQSDLPQILSIINYEILEGYAHFGIETQAIADIEREFETARDYPWVVMAEGERVLGFARANPWKSRGAYRRTCEVGVYVDPAFHCQGVATDIYRVLLALLKDLGFHTLLGGVAQPNPASDRLHQKFGFQYIGTFPETGWKKGAWRDVAYWALTFPDSALPE